MTLTIGSMFSGCGGLDYGMARAGLGPIQWFAENDRDASKVLAARWHEVPNLGDVTKVKWGDANGSLAVDILCGGFP